MTIKHLVASALVGLPLLALGRPASPELITITNADGTTAKVRLIGNEHFSYMTDAAGERIMEFDKAGNIRQATRNGRGLTSGKSDINLLMAEQLPVEQPLTSTVSRMAALDNTGRTTYPTVGEIHGLVVLLEYADTPFSTPDPVKTFSDLCNKEGYSDYGSVGSARDYYMACSNGLFRPTFDVVGPVKLAHEAAWYVGAGSEDDPTLPNYGKGARFGVAIQEAFAALDDTLDFSQYDLDEDGCIDNIFFFYSGYGQADTGNKNLVWPHQSDYLGYTNAYAISLGLPRLYADGVEMRTYACANELNGSASIPANKKPYIDGIGGFVHEYGHVIGLPDLYDVTGGFTKTPGKFSVMDKGSYNGLSTCPPIFSAYEKWLCRWIEYTDAVEGESYDLHALTSGDDANAVRIRIRRPGSGNNYYSEYFVLESRKAESWDEPLDESGMMIWRINFDNKQWVANQVNVGGKPYVEICEADDAKNLTMWPGSENEVSYLTPDMDQALVSSKNRNFKVWLSNIRYDDEKGVASFDYNKYTEYPEDVTVMKPATAEQAKHNIVLSWEPVQGADDYLLTVKYKNAAGKENAYIGFNGVSTEGKTYAFVNNVPVSLWGNQFSAEVKVLKNYPSKLSSNVITFVPAELEEYDPSGVEQITDGASIAVYGGHGEIIAPDGARVFNINGIETGKTDLPAGLYIVVCDGKSVKVAVK